MKSPNVNDVGKGWHELVQPLIDYCNEHNIEIQQIKEKFGMLRFYAFGGSTNHNDKELTNKIIMAEARSSMICEWCGKPGKLRPGGWVKTLCNTHAKAWESGERWWIDKDGKHV